MGDKADVIIIGAGVNGASTAFHLAKAGVNNIVVLERSYLAAGASGKSGALVRMHYTNPSEARLAFESLTYFQNWSELVGGDCGFKKVGFLLFVAPAYRDHLEANVAMLQGIGIDTKIITADDARELDPDLYLDDVTHLAYEPHSGYADPNATTYAFVQAAQQLGVEFRLDTSVHRILIEHDRIRGVETNQGKIEAPTVVVAAGAWANQLFQPLGIDLGLIPTTTSIAIFRWPLERHPGHPIGIDRINQSWLRPYDSSCTLTGNNLYNGELNTSVPTQDYDLPMPDFVYNARNTLAQRIPRMKHGALRGSWTCIYMKSPDAHPIIDKLPNYEGLYCITGDSGTSFKTSPAIGKCLSEWITEGSSKTVDLSPFRASRFAEGALWQDPYDYGSNSATPLR